MSAVLDQPRDQGNDSPQHSDQWAITPRSLVIGALIVLVLFGLWQARPHLKEVLHKAWNRDAPVDDSREIMSYRAAVLCFLGGVIFIFFWLWESGIPAWIAPCSSWPPW